MENQPLRPREDAAAGPGKPASSGEVGALRSTDVIASSGSAETENSGPPSEPRPNLETANPAQRTLSQLGDYLLLKKLGSGAMGAVYKARRLSTGGTVALKVLFKHVADNPRLVERFHREGRVTTNLEHPNIVRGFEAGHDHGWHYFAMEYVDGVSLQKWLSRLGKISLGDALHIVTRCARALQHAHSKEVVHRDIKPDNILITRKGEAKVADLGMVKQLDEDMSLTQTGHAVGTPWYMPLEQAKNAKETDGRCDIYALGCVFYCCLTGQPPFTGKTLVDVIYAKEKGTFPPARQSNHAVPERVDLIIAKMTAKLPKYRYQSCTEVLHDLDGLGLTNPSLSFLQALNPQAAQAEAQHETALAVSPSTVTPFPEAPKNPDGDFWYVRYKRPNGDHVVQKLTTVQVLRLVDAPDFDSGAKASRTPKEGFRALATIKEFEKAAKGKVARISADKHTAKSRKQYEKLFEEQAQRDKPKPGPVTNAGYWFGIIWRVALVSVLVGALLYAVTAAAAALKGLF